MGNYRLWALTTGLFFDIFPLVPSNLRKTPVRICANTVSRNPYGKPRWIATGVLPPKTCAQEGAVVEWRTYTSVAVGRRGWKWFKGPNGLTPDIACPSGLRKWNQVQRQWLQDRDVRSCNENADRSLGRPRSESNCSRIGLNKARQRSSEFADQTEEK